MLWLVLYILGVISASLVVAMEMRLTSQKFDKSRFFACIASWGTILLVYAILVWALTKEGGDETRS